ncbi:transmembrane protein 53-like isoform X2 [Acanthaster planci]|uniref:Transmembrane protein 53-like isoform X2 n=1 Tax=Acanthaster planci TaxID=133434 RepID=A0A8B7XSM8_ACAPL|nr:transmembrane protein 53-like isoform X2 [Acanthaster planci]
MCMHINAARAREWKTVKCYPSIPRLYCTVPSAKAPPSTKISSNLTLQKAPAISDGQPSKQRPLVLLLSWLLAKQRHLDNFVSFYTSRGCDVLTVRIRPLQIMMPTRGSQVIAKDVVEFLQREDIRNRKILVHSFSVGGYQYSEILQQMLASQSDNKEITSRIIGQIYDSPVDFNEVPIGMSKALLKNPILQKTMHVSLDSYLRLMYRPVTQHYLKSSEVFFHNPVPAPSLFFYSHTDLVATADASQRAIASLQNKMGYKNVYSKAFQDSPHVSHMYKHRDEYMETLMKFLESIEYFQEALKEHKDKPDLVSKDMRGKVVEMY